MQHSLSQLNSISISLVQKGQYHLTFLAAGSVKIALAIGFLIFLGYFGFLKVFYGFIEFLGSIGFHRIPGIIGLNGIQSCFS